MVGREPRQFGIEHNRWTLLDIRQVADWLRVSSAAGTWQMLRRLKIHYKRARGHVHSPDPDYLAKLASVYITLRSSEFESEHAEVLFQDEFTYYRQPSLAWAYARAGHRQPLAELGYRTNSAWRVVATLNARNGQVIFEQRKRITVASLVRFYQKVCAAYPMADVIYLVQDNWPVHYHSDVLAALKPQHIPWLLHAPANWPKEPSPKAQRLNLPIQLAFLPTYASWTNPIEKLWRHLKQSELHVHHFADDWDGLRRRVAAFLGQFVGASRDLLRYVGLTDPHKLYQVAIGSLTLSQHLVTVLNC